MSPHTLPSGYSQSTELNPHRHIDDHDDDDDDDDDDDVYYLVAPVHNCLEIRQCEQCMQTVHVHIPKRGSMTYVNHQQEGLLVQDVARNLVF